MGVAAVTWQPIAAQDCGNANHPPPHLSGWGGLGNGETADQIIESLNLGPELSRALSARQLLRERRKLDHALASVQHHRRRQIDAFVIAIALDSDLCLPRCRKPSWVKV